MTYTCKHCGKKVPALTLCGCDGARIEELTAENEALKAKLRAAGYPDPDSTSIEDIQRVMRRLSGFVEIQGEKINGLEAEVERLLEALAEYSEALGDEDE